MHELVEQDLHPVGIEPEHAGDRRIPACRRMVVGPEDVDRPVEAPVQLVDEIRDVGGAVGRGAALVGRADQHPVLFVTVGRGTRPEGAVLLVGVELRQQLGETLLEIALQRPAVEVDPEALHRALDRLEHLRHRVAGRLGELLDVGAAVAVLGHRLPATERLDRLAKAVHLRAGVVVVVLARDVVAGEREQARNTIAVRPVSRGRYDDRAGRIRGDHLDLHAFGRSRPSPRRTLPPSPRARRGRTRRRRAR